MQSGGAGKVSGPPKVINLDWMLVGGSRTKHPFDSSANLNGRVTFGKVPRLMV